MNRRKLITISAGTAAVLLGLVLWAGATPEQPDATVSTQASAQTTLLNQDGRPFEFEILRGKTVLLNFIFTSCPSVCPKQTEALERVQQGLPEEVRERVHFVSVSIDPERDTPEVLRAFATKHGVDFAHWSFVTGSEDALETLKKNYSAQALPEGAQPLDHRTEVRLIDPRGKLLQTYAGVPLDEVRLIRELVTVDRMSGDTSP